MINKKLLLGLGSIPLVALPVATIVSCGGGGEQLSNPQNQGDHQPNNPQGPNVDNNNTPPEINNTLSNIFDGLEDHQIEVSNGNKYRYAINVLARDFNKKSKDPNLPKKTKAEVLKIAEDKLNKLTQDEFAKLLSLAIMKEASYCIVDYSITEHANIRVDSLALSYAKDIVLNEDKTFSFTYVHDEKNKRYSYVSPNAKGKYAFKFENLKLIPEVYVDKKNNLIFPTFKIGFDENKLPTVKLLNRKKWIDVDSEINDLQQLVNEAIQRHPEKAEEIKKAFETFKVEYSKQLEIENKVDQQISDDAMKLSNEGKLGIDPNTNKFSINYCYGTITISDVMPLFKCISGGLIGYSATPITSYTGVVSAPLEIYSPIFFGTLDEKNKTSDWEIYLEQPEQPSTPLVQTQ